MIENDSTVNDNLCLAYYRYDLKNGYGVLIQCVSIHLEDFVCIKTPEEETNKQICGRFCLTPFWSGQSVAVLVSPFWHIAVLLCRRFDTGGLRETHPTVQTAPPMSLPYPNSNLNPNPKTKTNPNPNPIFKYN